VSDLEEVAAGAGVDVDPIRSSDAQVGVLDWEEWGLFSVHLGNRLNMIKI
jgi:hypothetical protein